MMRVWLFFGCMLLASSNASAELEPLIQFLEVTRSELSNLDLKDNRVLGDLFNRVMQACDSLIKLARTDHKESPNKRKIYAEFFEWQWDGFALTLAGILRSRVLFNRLVPSPEEESEDFFAENIVLAQAWYLMPVVVNFLLNEMKEMVLWLACYFTHEYWHKYRLIKTVDAISKKLDPEELAAEMMEEEED